MSYCQKRVEDNNDYVDCGKPVLCGDLCFKHAIEHRYELISARRELAEQLQDLDNKLGALTDDMLKAILKESPT